MYNRRFLKLANKMTAAVVLFLFFTGAYCFPVYAYDNVTIVIDPGHGGTGTADDSDLGAQYNGVQEKDLTLVTALALKDELEQYGNVTVYLTRAEDKQMSLKERVDYAVALGADALVSVHYNASEHHRFYGAEIFTSAFGQNYATGNGLAQCVMKRWTDDGAADKGIKTRIGNSGTDYYGIIRRSTEANLPAIILEHGYIDNDTDWSRIGNTAYWQHLGQTDAQGIADYFGLQKNVVQASVTPTVSVEVPVEIQQPDLTPPENVSVKIDAYDVAANEVTFTVSANENESSLMYFGAETETNAADADNSFMNLQLWENGESSMTGTFQVPADFDGNLVIRVYNNYELYTDSTPVAVSPTMAQAVGSAEGSTDEKQDGTIDNIDADTADTESAKAETNSQDDMLQDVLASAQNEANDSTVNTKTGSSRDSALVGLIAAASVAVIMLGIAVGMAVSTNRRRRRHHRRHK